MQDLPAKYLLTPEAELDIEGIWRYTFVEWGVKQANHYTDELIASFQELAKHPQRGRRADCLRKGYRCSRTGRHVIFYQTTDYGIAVIRILHERMLFVRHLLK
ncbi:MAG: type II toxin-antitoxin system RelE/ParE family toxin [Hyphomicrobiales bacterium]|nr:type II toxin-antitoxin system RelE/ParE family toxin [Hyphomicrobiales bacterium]MCY4032847.1 type II toxin-antitoxin system RelE/ParE family toxin [Hyphomicrobiales bacterium]MCY4038120.1 type II toxin-antitoxin system RelE/ParE family toxin [Hyphomicrobiales bacterium]